MDDIKLQRLSNAVTVSNRLLRPYRRAVRDLNEEYAGPIYGIHNPSKIERRTKYINLLKQAVNAYQTLLASNRPRVLLSTHRLDLRAFAKHFQVALNKLIDEIELEDVINQWVRDAFFWMGVCKVHMADSGQVANETDIRMDPGKPCVTNIALDDFFFDPNARKWSECQFMGDRYRMKMDVLKSDPRYKVPSNLQESNYHNSDRLSELSFGEEPNSYDVEPMVEVADIWLPSEKMIYTFLVANEDELQIQGQPIQEWKWIGTEKGPYRHLTFDEVSENVLPCSTAADLEPLDNLVNNLFRKNAARARRTKDIHAFPPSGTDDASRLNRASDGDWCKVQNPKDIQTIRSGNVDSNLHGFALNSMELFDRMAGGLQQMLGLGAASDTVGQEQLIHNAASKREGQLSARVNKGVNSLIMEMAQLLWVDEFTTLPARVDVEGLPGISYDATWMPGDREGEFKDYDIELDIYSMQYQGPAARITAINQLLSTIYLPMMPMIQQQGGSIDIGKLTELHSEMLNLPRLRDIVLFNQPPSEPGPQQDIPRKPPTSNRTYTRRNVSGRSGAVPDASSWMQSSSPKT